MHRPCQGPAIGLEKGLTSCLPPRTVGGGLEARKENLQEPPREPPPPPCYFWLHFLGQEGCQW